MMLKKAAAVGFVGLALGVAPANADSLSNESVTALTMISGGGVMSLGCMAIALLTEEKDEGYDRRGFFVGASASYARENFSDSSIVGLVGGEVQENLELLRMTGAHTPVSVPPMPPIPYRPSNYTFDVNSLDSDAFGGGGRAGYRCHSYVATELQFERLAKFNGSLAETDIPTNDKVRNFDLELESLVFTTNVKGYPLTGRYQPYALGGVGFMRMETKARDATTTPGTIMGYAAQQSDITVKVALRFGAGLDFYVTDNIVATLEGSYLIPTGDLSGLDYYSFNLGLQYRF